MTKSTKTILVTSAILVSGTLIFRSRIKNQGFSRNKFIANTFKVPYLSSEYVDLEEQAENIATQNGITFR